MVSICFSLCVFEDLYCSGSVPETELSEYSDPTKLAKLLEDNSRLRGLVEDLNKSKVKTDYELVNLRINLEEAKNENSTILQVR